MQQQSTGIQYCVHCGHANRMDYQFCTQCGSRLLLTSVDGGQAVVTAEQPLMAVPVAASQVKLCTGCRAVNEARFHYCTRCGLDLPAALYDAMHVLGNPAGFRLRLAAGVIDLVSVGGVTVLLAAMIEGAALDAPGNAAAVFGATISPLLGILAAMVYYTVTLGRWGKTLGKMLLGLKVVRGDGDRLSYWRAFGRYWAYYLSIIPFGLGVLAILMGPQKRSWHDLICNTRVLRVQL